MKLKHHTNRATGRLFLLLLFTLFAASASAPRRSGAADDEKGTVIGEVRTKYGKTERPLKGVRVWVKEKDENKGVGKTDDRGKYKFDYATGLRDLLIEKRPFYDDGGRDSIDIKKNKQTPSQTTYLKRNEGNEKAVLQAKSLLDEGKLAQSELVITKLSGQCNEAKERALSSGWRAEISFGKQSEDVEDDECALVRAALKSFDNGDIAQAKKSLGELISTLGIDAEGGAQPPPFSFRAGQSVYIVAYRQVQPSVVIGQSSPSNNVPVYRDNALDAEKEIGKRIEQSSCFRVVDKPSAADFVLLVNLDDNSVEGIAIPFDAYRQHFKEDFDIDALRDAAYGRYVIGPLKIATLGRLSDRLAKQICESVRQGGASSK